MLRFLLDKFKEAPGPFKQTRLIAVDLAEEIVDLAEFYLKRIKMDNKPASASQWDTPVCSQASDQSSVGPFGENSDFTRTKSEPFAEKIERKDPGPERTLDVSDELAKALDIAPNKKKQEFKVLAILWDAQQRNLGSLSAKAVSEHGKKLGLSIRHENVRKVIRMRLDKQVEIRTEQIGSGSVYRYQISPAGSDYFASKYFH
ncbi:MAG: hypothetical protein GY847_31120 [Proteobacteria bacterium]|nr:hypothetical protein [Pseudomonadota bacterium]